MNPFSQNTKKPPASETKHKQINPQLQLVHDAKAKKTKSGDNTAWRDKMDIESLINHDTSSSSSPKTPEKGTPNPAAPSSGSLGSSQPTHASSAGPSQGTMFVNYGPGQGGPKGIGSSSAAAQPPPRYKPPKSTIVPDPPRDGVSGRKRDKIPIDPKSVPDGTGDREWEKRRARDGAPIEGLGSFRVKRPS